MKEVKDCIFCGSPADTSEHVFARCFFDKPYPPNMLTVSSCHKCNQGYSEDEEYLMYLIDYLKSIELNNGDFTREKPQRTFFHGGELEKRMIDSIQIVNGIMFFNYEIDRITRVVTKIATCLFKYYYGKIVPCEILECRWVFSSQLSLPQLVAIQKIPFVTLQEGTVQFYCNNCEIGFCLSGFFYAVAKLVE